MKNVKLFGMILKRNSRQDMEEDFNNLKKFLKELKKTQKKFKDNYRDLYEELLDHPFREIIDETEIQIEDFKERIKEAMRNYEE